MAHYKQAIDYFVSLLSGKVTTPDYLEGRERDRFTSQASKNVQLQANHLAYMRMNGREPTESDIQNAASTATPQVFRPINPKFENLPRSNKSGH